MGNVNLPTPVALAGGAICVLGGYLLGMVAGPDQSAQSTATVASYDDAAHRLCLTGKGVDGTLCGTWRRNPGAAAPAPGDTFRFVTMSPGSGGAGDGHAAVTLIYGDVVATAR